MTLFLKRYVYEVMTVVLACLTYTVCNIASADILQGGGGSAAEEIQNAEYTFTTNQVSSALTAYPAGVSLGGEWLWTPGYGFMYVANWPWVYNYQTEIWYYNEGTASNLWMYRPSISGGKWMYTNADIFPWLFDSTTDTWRFQTRPSAGGASEIRDAESDDSVPEPTTPGQDEGSTPNVDVDPDIVISPAGG